MGAAMRELREAEQIMNRTWEGNLSQQGGDCPVSYFALFTSDTNILVLATPLL